MYRSLLLCIPTKLRDVAQDIMNLDHPFSIDFLVKPAWHSGTACHSYHSVMTRSLVRFGVQACLFAFLRANLVHN